MFSKEAIIALIAGTFHMGVLGSLYTFGGITPYIAAYLYYNDDQTSSTALSILFTLAIIMVNVGQIFSSLIEDKLNNKMICLLSIIMLSSSVLITSFFHSFVGFVIFYGIIYGFSIGVGYLAAIKNAYLHLPTRKGLVAGICISGFGLSSVLFNFVIVQIMNPNDLPVDPETKFFPEEVANSLPFALKILSGIYLIVGVISSLFVNPPKIKKNLFSETMISQQSNNIIQTNQVQQSMCNTYLQKRLYFIVIQISCIIPFGMFVAFNYKGIAFQRNPYFKQHDHLITLIGSIGIFANGIFRSMWGILFDKFSYRTLTIIINVVLLLCNCSILFAVKTFATYLIIVPIIYLCYGGMYALIPTQSVRVMGNKFGTKIFWLVFLGFSIASALQFSIRLIFVESFGEDDGFFYCIIAFGVLEFIGLFISIFIKYQYAQTEPTLLDKKQQITN